MLHPNSIERSVHLDASVLDFKTRLVEAFCEQCDKAQLISSKELVLIAKKNQRIDLIYPAIGDCLDHLSRIAEQSGIEFNTLKRRQDLFSWQFSKKGFFQFKKNIPDIISFLKTNS